MQCHFIPRDRILGEPVQACDIRHSFIASLLAPKCYSLSFSVNPLAMYFTEELLQGLQCPVPPKSYATWQTRSDTAAGKWAEARSIIFSLYVSAQAPPEEQPSCTYSDCNEEAIIA